MLRQCNEKRFQVFGNASFKFYVSELHLFVTKYCHIPMRWTYGAMDSDEGSSPVRRRIAGPITIHPSHMKTWTRTIVALFTLIALTLPVLPAQADLSSRPVPEEQVQRQIVHLLQSEETYVQERGIQLVFQFVRTEAYGASFFRPLETPLLSIITDGTTESIRIMAVSALYRIGTPRAMQRLHDAAPEIDNARVQRLSKRAVAQYRLDRAAEERERFVNRVMWNRWT